MSYRNKGFDPAEIEKLKEKCRKEKTEYVLVDEENHSDDYVQFQFPGKHEGKDVIYDCVIYTLRLHHSSEVYEMAEKEAEKKFPRYEKMSDEDGEAMTEEDEEIGMFIAEMIMEIEDEELVKVQEHVEMDEGCDYGISLDVGLNVEEVTPGVISKFIREFNSGTLKLDDTLYAFQTEEDEEED